MLREVELLRKRYRCLDFCFTDNALPPAEADRFFFGHARNAMRTCGFLPRSRTINKP